MYVDRTHEIDMTLFTDFYKSLLELAEQYEEQGLSLRIDSDLEQGSIHVHGEHSTQVTQARDGLNYALELAYTTSEHHPYWGLLHHAVQTASVVLEKWNDDMSDEDWDEIQWMVQELNHILEREESTRQR